MIKPFGTGHTINGLSVVGNVFGAIDVNIDRVEKVDTTFAGLDFGRVRNVSFVDNTFSGVDQEIRNPHSMTHAQATASRTWVCDTDTALPFNGRARAVERWCRWATCATAAGPTSSRRPGWRWSPARTGRSSASA